MRKRALLIVGVAMLIAAAGVVYAHWTDTLQVKAQVSTGTYGVDWYNIFTDDDNGNVIGEETGLPAPKFGAGSVDPSSAATVNPDGSLVAAATRYDKAVGNCNSGITDGVMYVNASNVYPSYHCTIWSSFNNPNSIPMKVQSIVTNTYVGALSETPQDITAYGDWETLAGTLCGRQIDPGGSITTVNTFHVLQGAAPGQTYRVEQTINLVNWNEWDSTACFHTFNGVPMTLPVQP
jgi:predicted ribosomally synthesized peptide with SipW-like signal peptide